MTVIERWTIHAAVAHPDRERLDAKLSGPPVHSGDGPVEVVRADAYRGAVAERDALAEALEQAEDALAVMRQDRDRLQLLADARAAAGGQ